MNIEAVIPLPIQIVIDDVGWWSGENGSARGEPYRTGIARDHVLADYQAIASLGRKLNMRPQAAMILSEWDTTNLLRQTPSCSWLGAQWDNSRRVGPWLAEAAAFIRANNEFFELTLHGIGHEFWDYDETGQWAFTRAEWHGPGGIMRPRAEVVARLELFRELLTQHGLGDFPTSFVPCAFVHAFGEPSENLAAILKDWGINFISTPFSSMKNAEQTGHAVYGFDHGVLTVDRGSDVMPWYAIGQMPAGELAGPICGMHWPNLLHEEPQRNDEIVSGWVEWLTKQGQKWEHTLAPDTARFASQLLHHYKTQCLVTDNSVTLDYTDDFNQPSSILVKVRSAQPLRFTCEQAQISKVEEKVQNREHFYSIFLKNVGRIKKVTIECRIFLS